MGADSWAEITTWREWEKVLTIVNIIVVTRPDYEIGFSHVTEEIRERIVDLRGEFPAKAQKRKDIKEAATEDRIFITDAVQIDVSATEIRQKIRENAADGAKTCRTKWQNMSKNTNFTFNIYHLSFN